MRDTSSIARERLLLSAIDAAQALSISERALWQWTHDGKVPFVRLGRRVLYDMRDLVAFIDKAKGACTRANADAVTHANPASTTTTPAMATTVAPQGRRARRPF